MISSRCRRTRPIWRKWWRPTTPNLYTPSFLVPLAPSLPSSEQLKLPISSLECLTLPNQSFSGLISAPQANPLTLQKGIFPQCPHLFHFLFLFPAQPQDALPLLWGPHQGQLPQDEGPGRQPVCLGQLVYWLPTSLWLISSPDVVCHVKSVSDNVDTILEACDHSSNLICLE